VPHFYQPDLGAESDNPFARDADNKLVRRGYWLDMNDRSLIMVMTQGIGAHLTNDEKRAHNKFVRNSPHLTESAIDDFSTQVSAHEKRAIVDRIENGV
jgi:hypothetical protein